MFTLSVSQSVCLSFSHRHEYNHIYTHRSPRGLKALTLRLLFRPDQEDVDASVNGEGLARAFKVSG